MNATPNQVLTHAARAAAKRGCKAAKFQPPLVAARGAREGLWLEQNECITKYCHKLFWTKLALI